MTIRHLPSTTYRKHVHQIYSKHRKEFLPAHVCLAIARSEARYLRSYRNFGFGPFSAFDGTTTHQLPNGLKLLIEIAYEQDYEPPWENCDGHGIVVHLGSHINKRNYWELGHRSMLYYDWRATIPIAIKDKWDSPPYQTGSKFERAMRAVKRDYDYLRRFCNNDWWYVWWCIKLVDENDTVLDSDSCGGFYSDDLPYIISTIRFSAARMVKDERDNRRSIALTHRINNRFNHAMECGL